MNIPYDNYYTIINMDENPFSLEIGLETLSISKEKKNIDIIKSGRESYRIYIILSLVGNRYKLFPL